ncbi:MAG: hypothetical protein QNK35_06320 [Bacteroides sp.]|nr:hypothetical protein [Bacteroides sp.]
MRIFATLTTIFAILIFAVSCNKESSQIDQLPRYVIKYNNYSRSGDTIKLEYSGNRVVKLIHNTYTTFYQYDKSGLPVSTSYTREGSEEMPQQRFTYQNGKLVKTAVISTDQETGIESESITMEFVHYGDTMVSMEYNDDLHGPRYLEEWHFNGSGNIYKSLKYYFHPDQSSMMDPATTYYEYDNSPHPASHVHENQVLNIWNSNNVIRQDRYDPEGESTNLLEFRYIYDEKDFPLVKILDHDTIEKYVYEAMPG